MKKQPIFLLLFLYFTTMSVLIGQDKNGEIIKEKNGKYVLIEQGKIGPSYQDRNKEVDLPRFAYHRYLPIGSVIKIINTKNNKSIKVTIKGKPHPYYNNKAILTLSRPLFLQLMAKDSYFANIQGELRFVTPIDSLLRVLDQSSGEDKFSTYFSLARYYQHYHPDTTLYYAQKIVDLSRSLSNLDREAEAWLLIGDIQMGMVNRKEVKRPIDLYGSWNPKGFIKKMAVESGYSEQDIIRWNSLGGDFFYLQTLFWPAQSLTIYPNPQQFSDTAYQHYLTLKEQQQDPDQIVAALKKLGDLHRLKSGYNEAESYYKRMLTIRENGDSNEKKAWTWGYLAAFYWEQKNYVKAEELFQKLYALRKSTSLQDPIRLIWVMGGLRNLRYTEGKIAEALALQSQLFPLYKKVKKERRASILAVVISDYLETFSDRKEEVLNALIKWYKEEAKEDYEKAILAQRIAKIYAQKKDFTNAAIFTEATIPFAKDEAKKIQRINDVAFYYQKDSVFRKSLSFYKKALKITRKLDNKTLEAIQYYKIAYYYNYQKKSDKANSLYKKALNTIKMAPDHSVDDYIISRQLQQIIKSQSKFKKWVIPFAEESIRVTEREYYKRQIRYLLRSIR